MPDRQPAVLPDSSPSAASSPSRPARPGSSAASLLRRGRLHRAGPALAILASTVALVCAPSAQAARRPSVTEVQRRIDQLQQREELATEQYDQTREQLSSLTVQVKAAQSQVATQRRLVLRARQEVGRMAAETYRRGTLSTLDLVLSDDPAGYLATAGLLPSLTERQVGAARRLALQERKLSDSELSAVGRRRSVAAAYARLAAQRATINHTIAQAAAELASLKASERAKLIRASRAAVRVSLPGGKVTGSVGRSSCRSLTVVASSRVRKVIDFACAQLGEPYSYGAAGPGSWDCSGLTMKSWAQAGVSLPHSSQMQASYGTRVSRANLQPGDLVFFYSPIHHVGIYLGQGMMIHAPHTGDVVRIAPLESNLTTAVRL